MKHSNIVRKWAAVMVTMFVATYAGVAQQYAPQMGADVRPDYEVFRMDQLTTRDDISYTGDLGLSIPVLVVPGRHGHDFQLTLSYNSSITQRQSASWVGLGWSLELGAVERSVIGRSDEQINALGGSYNLGNDNTPGSNPSALAAELVGRLSLDHKALPIAKHDQVDMYKLLMNGSATEMLPFPPTTMGVDTLSEGSFLMTSYKPWRIEAFYNPGAGTIHNYTVTVDDGTVYKFGDGAFIGDRVQIGGKTGPSNYWQSFMYPYRWNLTSIAYPEGDSTVIKYKDYTYWVKKNYETIMIDRSDIGHEERNFFDDAALSFPHASDTVKYSYSSPESLFTNTHVLIFKTAHDNSTERDCRLDTLILKERFTNKEVKRIIFAYADSPNSAADWQYNNPQSPLPVWDLDEKLNNNQLTLVSLKTRAGSGAGAMELPPYKFTYHFNPKINLFNITTLSQNVLDFTGAYLDTVFGTAWRLKELTLPTGSKITYSYERLNNGSFEVLKDPEGNTQTAGNPFSQRAEPRCRIISKVITGPLHSPRTWKYSYGEEVYDPPTHPTQEAFIPKMYRGVVYYDLPTEYYKFFRGCGIGHRWVRLTNPDGTWKQVHFTSSIKSMAGIDPLESYPDSVPPSIPGGANPIVIRSNAGKRGLVWKEQTQGLTTTYRYAFTQLGTFNDQYEYHPFPGGGYTADRIQYRSFRPILDSVITSKDGVTTCVNYAYNSTRREMGLNDYSTVLLQTGSNGLVQYIWENGGQFVRKTEYKYAAQIYPGMDSAHLRSQIYRTTISLGENDKESATFTTYWKVNNRWVPKKEWVWKGSPTELISPADTTSQTVPIQTYTYDTQGFLNVTDALDANGSSILFYYGDTLTPYSNTTAGLRRGLVTGVEKYLSSPLLRTSLRYNQFNQITRKKDENADSTSYLYDVLGRLTSIKGPANQLLQGLGYTYSNGTTPNILRNSLYRSATDSIYTTFYYDGVGYERQTQVRMGAEDIISATSYDSLWRVDSLYKPFQRSNPTHVFDPNYNVNAQSYYDTGASPAGYSPAQPSDYPFTRNEYLADGTNRLKHVHPPEVTFQSEAGNRYVKYDYYNGTTSTVGPNAVDPTSTVMYEPIWSWVGGGSIHGALADGAIFNDGTYIHTGAAVGVYVDDSCKVKLGNFPAQLSFSSSVVVKFRAVRDAAAIATSSRREKGSRDTKPKISSLLDIKPNLYVYLLEGSTTRGQRTISWEELTYSGGFNQFSFAVDAALITNPNDLYVVLRIEGKNNQTAWDVDVSWLRVENDLPTLFKTKITDEQGETTIETRDGFGYIAQTIGDSSGLKVITEFGNDVFGKAKKVINPVGQTSYYSYNTRSQLVDKWAVDAGSVRYRYDLNGNLRFVQDSNKTQAARFIYRKYDRWNRLVEIGEYWGGTTFSAADSTTTGTPANDFPNTGVTQKTLLAAYVYDQNTTGDPDLTSARKLLGRLFNSQSYTNGVRDDIYYSYDEFGRIEWQMYKMTSLASKKKIAYEYNFKGDVTKVSYVDLGKALNNTYIFYEYDGAGRLQNVYSGLNSNGTGKVIEAVDSMFANGTLKRMRLSNVQGVDYRYNERDWLSQINHQNLNTAQDPGHDGANGIPVDKYGQIIGYHDSLHIGQWQGAPKRFDGNISWTMYNMSGLTYTGAAGTANIVGYSYVYDNIDRLTKADYGYYVGGWQSTPAFDEALYTYDKVGNIDTVKRYGSNGSMMDDMKYNYYAGTNKLSHIDDQVSAGAFANDLDDQFYPNYIPDGNGNIFGDLAGGIGSPIIYDHRNLPISIPKSGVTTTYRYDAEGNRTYKSGTTGGTYYYLNDIFGRTLVVVKSDGDPRLINLHGVDNFGYIFVGYNGAARADVKYYHLKDHVGTVKMTIKGDGTIAGYDDYYPFGMVMSGRSMTSTGDGRYKFITRERDVESGYDWMGARAYDARVGRFLTPDPLVQLYALKDWSPYQYSFDNPVIYKDETGKSPVIVIGGIALGAAELATLGLVGGAAVLSSMGSERIANDMRALGEGIDQNFSQPIIDYTKEQFNNIFNPTGQTDQQTQGLQVDQGVEQIKALDVQSITVGQGVEARHEGKKVTVLTHVEPISNGGIHIQISGTKTQQPIDPSKPIGEQVRKFVKGSEGTINKIVKNIQKAIQKRDALNNSTSDTE